MNPVVRVAYFAGISFLVIIVLLCAAWLAAVIYFLVAYGLTEGITFALGSIYLFVLVFSMIYHDRP